MEPEKDYGLVVISLFSPHSIFNAETWFGDQEMINCYHGLGSGEVSILHVCPEDDNILLKNGVVSECESESEDKEARNE